MIKIRLQRSFFPSAGNQLKKLNSSSLLCDQRALLCSWFLNQLPFSQICSATLSVTRSRHKRLLIKHCEVSGDATVEHIDELSSCICRTGAKAKQLMRVCMAGVSANYASCQWDPSAGGDMWHEANSHRTLPPPPVQALLALIHS